MAKNDERKVSEDFVIRVFDKVKEANESTADDIKDLREAIIVFGEAFNKRFEGQPRPVEAHNLLDSWGKTFEIRHQSTSDKLDTCATRAEDIHTLLQQHCDHSDAGVCSIEDELKKDEGILKKIQDAINVVKTRVTIMITVVAAAFAIFVVAYFFVASSVERIVEIKMEKIEKHYQQDIQVQLDELTEILRQHSERTE
jgi:hypothetical protein